MYNALTYSIQRKNLQAVLHIIDKVYLGEMLRIKIMTFNEDEEDLGSYEEVKEVNEITPKGKIQTFLA